MPCISLKPEWFAVVPWGLLGAMLVYLVQSNFRVCKNAVLINYRNSHISNEKCAVKFCGLFF